MRQNEQHNGERETQSAGGHWGCSTEGRELENACTQVLNKKEKENYLKVGRGRICVS